LSEMVCETVTNGQISAHERASSLTD